MKLQSAIGTLLVRKTQSLRRYFPHYWSAENGRTFKRYARLTGNEEYNIRGEHSLRGVLSMFFEDGTATCAYVYPYSVNGQKTDFADPYANDQDWGLCMNLE